MARVTCKTSRTAGESWPWQDGFDAGGAFARATALAEVKAQGRAAGTPTFGYRKRPDGYLEEDGRERAVIRRVAELRTVAESWQAVAATFTEEGHQTRTGRAFSASGLHAIWRRREVAA